MADFRKALAALAIALALISARPAAAPPLCGAPIAVAPAPGMAANSTLYSDGMPPARFRGDGKVKLVLGGELERKCGVRPPCGYEVQGCADPPARKIFMPNPCAYPSSDDYARRLCHELAHVNGWPKTHGD